MATKTSWYVKVWNALVSWGSKKENQKIVVDAAKQGYDQITKK